MRPVIYPRRFTEFCVPRLMRDRSGASGVEFALVVPILLFLLAGTVDLGHALTVSRKIDQIASTTGDMISQQGTWTKSDVARAPGKIPVDCRPAQPNPGKFYLLTDQLFFTHVNFKY